MEAWTHSSEPQPGIYTYNDLDPSKREIRLIRILPPRSNNDLAIECELVHVSLTEDPQYQALSYVWGHSSGRVPIRVNDKVLYVTRSLHQALLSIRDAVGRPCKTLVWADALCINQGNVEERNEQVQMMQDIFTGASNVAISLDDFWLNGLVKKDAGASITHLISVWQLLNEQSVIPRWPSSHEDLWHRASSAIESLLKHPWWRRVWIIQEILCARSATIHRLQDWMPFDDFLAVSLAVPQHYLDKRSITEYFTAPGVEAGMLEEFRMFATNRRHLTTFDLMCKFAWSDASDRKDRIYGLLGVLKFHNRKIAAGATAVKLNSVRFPVDYALSEREVYIQLVHHHIEQTRNLVILYLAQGIDQATGEFRIMFRKGPSWLPEWESWRRDVQKCTPVLDPSFGFRAAGSSMAENFAAATTPPDPSVLQATGYVLLTVFKEGRPPDWKVQEGQEINIAWSEYTPYLMNGDLICLLSGSGLPFVLRKITRPTTTNIMTATTTITDNTATLPQSRQSAGSSSLDQEHFAIISPCIVATNPAGKFKVDFRVFDKQGWYTGSWTSSQVMNGKKWEDLVNSGEPLRTFLLV